MTIKIENAQYQIPKEHSKPYTVVCTWEGQELHVPIAEGNRHYDEVMRQVKSGTLTIKDAD